jgi:siroheme synthase-like protein
MNIFPVNLLLKGKKCLIVGGGKVAARKMNALIAAGAEVTVVSEKSSEKIISAAKEGKIKLISRKFRMEDIDGLFLLYLATDDRALNLKIFNEASKRNILTCIVDRNWRKGDFITPAVLHKDEITISVSTNGSACRKSKLIKDNLLKHIEAVETSRLLVIGTDHRLLEGKLRSPLHIHDSSYTDTADKISTLLGVHEFVILNTCNRVELIAAVSPSEKLLAMLKMILGFDKLDPDSYYVRYGFEAFRKAEQNGCCGGLMRSLHNAVIHTAKHIRRDVVSKITTKEIESVAAEYIRKKFPDGLSGRHVIIAGTGKLGSAVKSELEKEDCSITWLYHSTKPAEQQNSKIDHAPLKEAGKSLPSADILITALSAEKPPFTEKITSALSEDALIIDLGTPPNVETDAIHDIITLEKLKDFSKAADSEEKRLLQQAFNIVDTHKDIYEKFKKSFIDGNQGK